VKRKEAQQKKRLSKDEKREAKEAQKKEGRKESGEILPKEEV